MENVCGGLCDASVKDKIAKETNSTYSSSRSSAGALIRDTVSWNYMLTQISSNEMLVLEETGKSE